MTPKLKTPKSSISEVLFELIRKRRVSFHNFNYMQDFRKIISDIRLKLGLKLDRKLEKCENKYGKHGCYAVHILPEKERNRAVKLYMKLVER